VTDGHVLVIAPVAKVDRSVLSEVVGAITAATRDRRSLVVIDMYGGLATLQQTAHLDEWEAVDPYPSMRAAVLSAALQDGSNAAWTELTERVVDIALRLRHQGHHVIVVGPYLLPDNDALYSYAVRRMADAFLLVGRTEEVASYMREHVEYVSHAVPREKVLVLTYKLARPNMPDEVDRTTFTAPWFDLGVVDQDDANVYDSIAGYLREVVPLMGLPELTGGWAP
jgi:hypothetical protein